MHVHDALDRWTAALASPAATPAGGAAAAVSAALASALVEMVAGMTGSRERYASVHDEANGARTRGLELRKELLALAWRDAAVFAGFERALALPKSTAEERVARAGAKAVALREGAGVQFTVLERTAEVAELAAKLAASGLATAIGDSATAVFLAGGAARSAYWAVRSNLEEVEADAETARWLRDGLGLVERTEAAEWRVRQLLSERVR